MRRFSGLLAAALLLIAGVIRAEAETPAYQHALAMHGEPALDAGFAHFPYANPSAPQGGTLTLGESGGFDSLNPFTIRGRAHWSITEHVYESLMERSRDEPFTLYGLLADGVSTPEDRSSVSYRLNPEARFSDGSPVTLDDVIFSFETLRDKGRPNHRSYYGQVASVERLGEREVRFVFEKPNRELPLLLGLMPILPKAAWDGRDITQTSLETPIGSGPYVLESFEAGRFLRYRRNPDYWGNALGVAAGRHNPETVEYQFFRDGSVLWQAFTAGALDLYQDGDPAHWAEAYDIPAVNEGRVRRMEIPHSRASGMEGFTFNTRRPLFADRAVRAALAQAFDFEWVNQRFYRGGYKQIESYYSGSSLGFQDPASPTEAALLEPFAAELPPGTIEQGWRPAEGSGDGRNRRGLRAARKALEAAGWTVTDGVLQNAAGEPFRFEILLGSNRDERVARAFADALEPLGIAVELRLVDQAQYQSRLTAYDYDMIVHRWYLSLSPGEEQRFYWGSKAASQEGTRNYMGVESAAVDAMIDALLAARSRDAFEEAVHALDRVLSSGVYVIPLGYLATDRVAAKQSVGVPERSALYGFRLDAVWIDPDR